MAINKAYLTCDRTAKGDECYTPYYAVEPILKYVPKNKIIWCPFDEEWSAFYQTFLNNGYNVIRSSLKDGKDFFEYEPEKYDIIISNPPFSKKDDVLKRVYSLGKPFMLLLPLNSLQSVKRYNYFKNGIQILAFDKRISYHTNDMQHFKKANHFASAYYCKDILPKDLVLEKITIYEKAL